MQRFFLAIAFAGAFSFSLSAQAGLTLYSTNVNAYGTIEQFEVNANNYIINESNAPVTFRWTRTLQQPFPTDWSTAFCDVNLCYLGQVGTAEFTLEPGDTSVLKPVIYPNGATGYGVYLVQLESITPGVTYQVGIVYSVTVTETSGVSNVEALREAATVFPNPTAGSLNVSFVDPGFRGNIQITDALGRTVLTQNQVSANTQLDVSALPAGVYTVHAWTEAGQLVLSKGFSRQ